MWVIVVAMAQRPGLEPGEAEQQQPEGDEGRQPAAGAQRDEGDDDEGVGREQEGDEHGPHRRPAGLAAAAGIGHR